MRRSLRAFVHWAKSCDKIPRNMRRGCLSTGSTQNVRSLAKISKGTGEQPRARGQPGRAWRRCCLGGRPLCGPVMPEG